MNPYRQPAPRRRRPAREELSAPFDDLTLGILCVVIGAVPMVMALATHAVWGVEASFGMLLFLFGGRLVGAQVAARARRARLLTPRAKEVREWSHPGDDETEAMPEHESSQLADERSDAGVAPARAPVPALAWLAYVWAAVLVTAPTALSTLGRNVLALPDMAMLYLLVIIIVAARFGRGPSVLAAALSVASYDFFCVPPFYTFAVHDVRNVLTFVTMFGVGLVISGLTARLRRRESEAKDALVRQERLGQERARLAEDAKAAALKARTEEMRSSLLSAVSHDLRTPLAAITGAATTLRGAGAELGGRARAEMVDTICEEAERLERLVANLLDMTRLVSGALHVKRAWVPVEEFVGSALGRVEKQLDGRAVVTDLPASLPLVSVDPVLLEQVFVNLLENVAKYTPAGSGIEIRARTDGDDVLLEIADHGPGLPRGAEATVFERFYRGPQAEGIGTGLGLAICRGIVEAHGGTIFARNAPGGGAVFQLRLPRGGAAPSVPDELEAPAPAGAEKAP